MKISFKITYVHPDRVMLSHSHYTVKKTTKVGHIVKTASARTYRQCVMCETLSQVFHTFYVLI